MWEYITLYAAIFDRMASESIIASWKKRHFKPVYWLEGPEEFFIDEILNYAEHSILSEDESQFNLTIFYGRDTLLPDVLNACRRYPVFTDRQVVLIKEAQDLKGIEKLESYVEKPNASTILVVGYKGKTLDGRTKFARTIKQQGELFTSRKVYDNQLPAWINGYVQSKGLQINPRALTLLVDHVGNDLSRITNEIKKISLNLGGRTLITEDEIETYIGISKDYNIFELLDALSYKNIQKAISIIQYMDSNPKIISIHLLVSSLHGYFTKLMTLHQMPDKNESTLKGLFYNNPNAVKQAVTALKNYSFSDMEKAVLLLQHYNLKFIGIDSYNTPNASLMKELVYKIMY
ncbi:MAG TPA: DNA polymerase III subunit delta [Saprospiraceae bacterium]|nr:DNA polymerase III subunit delta [Saprospiraceae bacterium]